MNLDSNFCTLDTSEIDKDFAVQKSEAELDLWAFEQESHLEGIRDIFGEADQRRLTSIFGSQLFPNWNNRVKQILK